MTAPSLRDLYTSHQGKVTDKWSFYLDAYENLLAPYRLEPIRLLEIGIQNGGSLDVWTRYFPNAERLVGCDINVACASLVYEDSRIGLVVGDANEDETQLRILDLSPRFDVILDDGSHQSLDIVKSFTRYFPYLNEGGIYVAEDLHCSYWSAFGGGLFHPYSSVNFFKRLADIVNFEHWGVLGARADVIKSFLEEYNCNISATELAQIHSVEFLNSMCVIRKKRVAKNVLGPRMIAGTEARVFPQLLELQGQLSSEGVSTTTGDGATCGNDLKTRLVRLNEAANPWSRLTPLPEVERQEIINRLALAESKATALLTASDDNQTLRRQLSHALKALDLARKSSVKAHSDLQAFRDEKSGVENAMRAELSRLRETEAHFRATAEALYSSTSWRITGPVRWTGGWWIRQRDRAGALIGAMQPGGSAQRQRIRTAFARRLGGPRDNSPLISDPSQSYADWIDRFDTLSTSDRTLIKDHISGAALPAIAVVWLLGTESESSVQKALNSLQSQLHAPAGCLIITGSAKVDAGIASSIAGAKVRSALKEEDLIPLVGKAVLLVQGAGTLSEHALYLFATAFSEGHQYAFSDQDVADSRGKRQSPQFAPKYSPEFPAIGNLGMVHMTSDIVRHMAGAGAGGVTVPKLMSEALSGANAEPQHLPFILLHTDSASLPFTPPDQSLTAFSAIDAPLISLIIPTRDRLDFMEPCISSILEKTDYPRDRYEIVVVDNGSTEPALLRYLDKLNRDGQVVLSRDPSKFNYSRLNNEASKLAKGDYLAFVNNDVVVNDPLWLRRLVVQASRPGIGAVGAKLLYPDMTVQHGGIVLGIQGVAAHAHHNLQANDPGYMGLSTSTHAISAVTGACLMVKRAIFQEAGGFDEELAVAFNDVLLCMSIAERGYRNIYVSSPLLIHFESKTRGYDDTEAKQALFRREARYARSKHRKLFKNDPFYNENLSLERVYDLAFPPRMEKPWHRFRRESSRKLNILMLSSTHQIGHGVAVVVDLQARHLQSEGHRVFVGGPLGAKEFPYAGCQRAYLDSPQEAAVFAMQYGIDCVVMHTPPFYSTIRWLGSGVKTMAYDYGEPDPDFFPDAAARKAQLLEKAFCLDMTDELYAISAAVKDEAPHERMGVIPLGNSHLATWGPDSIARRSSIRANHQWADKTVVFNVCRFHEGERYYKGIDEYCRLREHLLERQPEAAESFVFALAGKGTEADVAEMEARGLVVFANVSDDELVDLYCGADIYANFSRWEGYNLGIGQALAMGLLVVASDIPAHRAFGVFTSNDPDASVSKIQEFSTVRDGVRDIKLSPWDEPLAQFSQAIQKLCL